MFQLHVPEIAGILQSVIAPAFLLAGIGTFLNVMTQRLSRAVDRVREMETECGDEDTTPHAATRSGLRSRLRDVLVRRARLINRAIGLSTTAALCLCSLIAGLVTFLRELFLATENLRKAYLRTEQPRLRKAA